MQKEKTLDLTPDKNREVTLGEFYKIHERALSARNLLRLMALRLLNERDLYENLFALEAGQRLTNPETGDHIGVSYAGEIESVLKEFERRRREVCSLSPATIERLKRPVADVHEIPANTQESGKCYAYAQVASALMEMGCEGAHVFAQAVIDKAARAGWGERSWLKELRKIHRRRVPLEAQ